MITTENSLETELENDIRDAALAMFTRDYADAVLARPAKDGNVFDAVKRNVMETSGFHDEKQYGMDDIRYACGRIFSGQY